MAAAACALAVGARGVGWWLDYSQEPEPADLAVVLAGSYCRPLYAADLYHRGLFPEVWLSRPFRPEVMGMLEELGIGHPREEEVNREILLKRGVPPERVRLYGSGVMSTANEALALAREARLEGRRLLVITSRTHARRARLIFRRLLPGVSVRVAATPYEPFDRRWWRHQWLAREAVLEMSKLAFFALGGRYVAPLEDTPHVQP